MDFGFKLTLLTFIFTTGCVNPQQNQITPIKILPSTTSTNPINQQTPIPTSTV